MLDGNDADQRYQSKHFECVLLRHIRTIEVHQMHDEYGKKVDVVHCLTGDMSFSYRREIYPQESLLWEPLLSCS